MAHNVKLVKMLSSLEGVNINFKNWNRNGDTMLHCAASSTDARDVEIVKIILAHPHVDINKRNREFHDSMQCVAPRGGETPLHIATRAGNVEVVRMLMSRVEFDVNVLNAHRQQPIALAALGRHKEIFEMLFDHKDVHVNMHLEFGPLLKVASCHGCGERQYNDDLRDIVRILATDEKLDVSAPIYCACDGLDNPVLVWAAGNRDPYLMKLLLERDDIDVNITNEYMHTALHSCFKNGYPHNNPASREILKLLLSQKDINVHKRDCNQQTPADLAEENGFLDIYEQLLSESSAVQQNASVAGASADANLSACCIVM